MQLSQLYRYITQRVIKTDKGLMQILDISEAFRTSRRLICIIKCCTNKPEVSSDCFKPNSGLTGKPHAG